MLKGYKTYITAIVGAVTAIGMYLSGDATLAVTVQTVVTCLIGAFLRSGVANS